MDVCIGYAHTLHRTMSFCSFHFFSASPNTLAAEEQRNLEEDAAEDGNDDGAAANNNNLNGYYGYGYYDANGVWTTPYKTMFQIQYYNIVLWTSLSLFVVLAFAIFLVTDMPLEVSTFVWNTADEQRTGVHRYIFMGVDARKRLQHSFSLVSFGFVCLLLTPSPYFLSLNLCPLLSLFFRVLVGRYTAVWRVCQDDGQRLTKQV